MKKQTKTKQKETEPKPRLGATTIARVMIVLLKFQYRSREVQCSRSSCTGAIRYDLRSNRKVAVHELEFLIPNLISPKHPKVSLIAPLGSLICR